MADAPENAPRQPSAEEIQDQINRLVGTFEQVIEALDHVVGIHGSEVVGAAAVIALRRLAAAQDREHVFTQWIDALRADFPRFCAQVDQRRLELAMPKRPAGDPRGH